ncbi:MAG: hypothetical protein RLT30_03430 [Gammaproteobacteria bacterium]
MFALIRKRQQTMAIATLSLFMGAWLLLLCQSCFANDEVNSAALHDKVVELEHCHDDSQQADLTQNYETEEHCTGVCDCDESTILMHSKEQNKEKNSYKFSPDIVYIIHKKSGYTFNFCIEHVVPDRSSALAQNSPVSLYNKLLI